MNMKKAYRHWLLIAVLLLLSPFSGKAEILGESTFRYTFQTFSSRDGLPNDEVQALLQDSMGYIWIGTRAGLYRYDGYSVKTFANNLAQPDRFTSNYIYTLAEDRQNRLWIGTENGLNIMDLTTGHIRKIIFRGERGYNIIRSLLCDRRGNMWIGTDAALLFCAAGDDRFRRLSAVERWGDLPRSSVHALWEARSGRVYIGTWGAGLYCYDPSEGVIRFFDRLRHAGQSHAVVSFCEDSRGSLWAGTWGGGLYRLRNPEAGGVKHWEHFGAPEGLPDQIIYRMAEDPRTRCLWVATRGGLFIMPVGGDSGISYRADSPDFRIPCNEVTSVISGRGGQMWVATLGGGVLHTNTALQPIRNVSLSADPSVPGLNGVRSLHVDGQGTVWVGVSRESLLFYDPHGGAVTSWRAKPEFAAFSSLPSVSVFMESRSGTIYMGMWGGGLLCYRKGQPVRQLRPGPDAPWLTSGQVNALGEDRRGNLLIGTDDGLAVLHPDGRGEALNRFLDPLDLDGVEVFHIEPARDGTFWVSTAGYGALRLQGDLGNPSTLKARPYYDQNGGLPMKSIHSVYQDRRGNLWAASLEYGLFLYDSSADRFLSANERYGIPTDRICAIEEDNAGNLWLSTNDGIIRFALSADMKRASIRTFSTSDGLQSNFYIARTSCRHDSLLYFGYYGGFSYFDPGLIATPPASTPTRITGLSIRGIPFADLPVGEQRKISPKMPGYADRIVLSHRQNNFSIEFANLSYTNSLQNRYAYRLEGYEQDWKQADAAHRTATYTNLPSGTYRFSLRAMDLMGTWQENPHLLTVVIRPPWWATWWAFLLYALALAGMGWWIYRFLKKRAELRNSLLLGELEREKIQELNHNKLQFFTNITHDLMTPLSIISLTVDELKSYMPKGMGQYEVMKSNIGRLMRLLQQILEFRKAETGNLQLRVSPDDLPAFVRREVESFLPLVRSKELRLDVECSPSSFRVYFDPDKIDKMLYNLLSNAVKYNRRGREIRLAVSCDPATEEVRIDVRDNGEGIPRERQADLFKPFYEGDYRRFKTHGTGIGLFLTKELVELHHGHISVESGPDGTLFSIVFPGGKAGYAPEEIGENLSVSSAEPDEAAPSLSGAEVWREAAGPQPAAPEEEGETGVTASSGAAYTLLLVDDNEDLLTLVERQLKPEYRILTATDGEEALRTVEAKEVDLIVSDIMMPGMDGNELCRRLKSDIKFCHIPVILLTAKNREEDRLQAYELGADAYLTKPFRIDLLRTRIANLLRARERARQDFRQKYTLQLEDSRYLSLDADFLRRATDCVQRNLGNAGFDLQQFADDMLTSKSTLFKKLKSLTGMNPTSFVRNARLKVACHILREQPSIRIAELAERVGFADAKYFSVCFKKEFDLTPSEFAARCE